MIVKDGGSDLLGETVFDLLDEAPDVASPGQIGLHEGAEASVFADDFIGPLNADDLGELTQRDHLFPIRAGDEHVAEAAEILSLAPLEAHLNGVTDPTLDRGGDVGPAESP